MPGAKTRQGWLTTRWAVGGGRWAPDPRDPPSTGRRRPPTADRRPALRRLRPRVRARALVERVLLTRRRGHGGRAHRRGRPHLAAGEALDGRRRAARPERRVGGVRIRRRRGHDVLVPRIGPRTAIAHAPRFGRAAEEKKG